MAVSRFSFGLIVALISLILMPSVRAQTMAPAPAPVSDGTTIDQGIAYVLMFAALALTYLIHTSDTPLNF